MYVAARRARSDLKPYFVIRTYSPDSTKAHRLSKLCGTDDDITMRQSMKYLVMTMYKEGRSRLEMGLVVSCMGEKESCKNAKCQRARSRKERFQVR